MDREAFAVAAMQIGLHLSGEQLDAFAEFEDSLYRANEVMNLTRVPRTECGLRHFLDSLLLHDLISREANVLDIGSGAGFPAWPLALARPDLNVTALDSSNKTSDFLRSHLLPNLTVATGRAEDLKTREAFDFVTGRALAPLAAQLEVSTGQAKIGGLIVPMRTPNDLPAIEGSKARILGIDLEMVERRPLPGTDVTRVFPIYRKDSPTPARFPRKWAEIKSKPLF